ncbi:MAG: hypothetical protein OEN01_02495 [Candidatus Krumholzibacteria bacterium]|nr:hypothetical protein [Candidatus Krumholzibacteria bacterium]
MSIQSLRLPKLVESDPRGTVLRQSLIEHAQPIRAGSEISVAVAQFDGLESALQSAHRAGRVVRGLETAERSLATEERGLRLVNHSSGVKRGDRVSRLLLLTDDGSDGFYRQVENLLRRHGPRVLAIRLNVDAAGLGAPLFGAGRTTRLLLIQHKEAVVAVLLGVAKQFGSM